MKVFSKYLLKNIFVRRRKEIMNAKEDVFEYFYLKRPEHSR